MNSVNIRFGQLIVVARKPTSAKLAHEVINTLTDPHPLAKKIRQNIQELDAMNVDIGFEVVGDKLGNFFTQLYEKGNSMINITGLIQAHGNSDSFTQAQKLKISSLSMDIYSDFLQYRNETH